MCTRLVCVKWPPNGETWVHAVEEVDLDSATSDGDYDSDKEVYESCVSAKGLPHGRVTMN